jgi:hypothetical protein
LVLEPALVPHFQKRAVRNKMHGALQTGYWQTKLHIGWMLSENDIQTIDVRSLFKESLFKESLFKVSFKVSFKYLGAWSFCLARTASLEA